MSESFELPVLYKHQQRIFDAVFTVVGFSYRITVLAEGRELIFEPDEERNFRACMAPDARHDTSVDPLLLQAIATALEQVFR